MKHLRVYFGGSEANELVFIEGHINHAVFRQLYSRIPVSPHKQLLPKSSSCLFISEEMGVLRGLIQVSSLLIIKGEVHTPVSTCVRIANHL